MTELLLHFGHFVNEDSVIAALRRGNLAAFSTDVCARLSEMPPFKPGAGSATSAGMTELLRFLHFWHSGLHRNDELYDRAASSVRAIAMIAAVSARSGRLLSEIGCQP